MAEIKIDSSLAKTQEEATLRTYEDEFKQLLREVEGGEQVPSFAIETQEDLFFAGELLKFVKAKKSDLESRKKTVTKPLNDALTAFRKLFNPTLKPLERLELVLKRCIGEWQVKQEAIEAEAVRQITAASIRGDFDAAHQAGKMLQAPVEIAGVGISTKWVLDTDNVNLEQVPLSFLTIDFGEVDKYIASFKKAKPDDVPGLVFKKVGSVRGSTKG